MKTISAIEPELYQPDETLPECARSRTPVLPLVYPVVVTTLVEDDETTITEEQPNISTLPSSVNVPRSNVCLHRISSKWSTIVDPSLPVNSKAILNVGGIRHEVMWHTLARLPSTRLGRLSRLRKSTLSSSDPKAHDEFTALCDDYNLSSEEYFFDRNPRSFTSIIDFYRTGKLHLMDDVCVISFHDDLVYWDVDENNLELCCQTKYQEKKEYFLEEMRKEVDLLTVETEKTFSDQCLPNTKRKLWNLFENSHSSKTARIISLVNIAFILLSSVTLTISTIEGVGCAPNRTDTEASTDHMNASRTAAQSVSKQYEIDTQCREPLAVFLIEVACVSWFTFEYLIRLYAAPNKSKFFKGVLNTIDLIAIAPFYLSILIEVLDIRGIKNLKSVRKATEVFRVLRIMRILKLARHSTGLQSLGYTLRRSYKELSMLLMFLAIFVLLFSSLVYYAEKDENAQFRSIPHAFWWASITMTTVGYGDMYPTSVWGKLIGSVCAICGVLVIALPIPIIVNNFAEYYKERLRHEKALKRQKTMDFPKRDGSVISLQSQYILNSPLSLAHSGVHRHPTNTTADMSIRLRTGDETWDNSTCYERKTSLSPSKEMQHAIDLFSDHKQNLGQENQDSKEALLTRTDTPIDDKKKKY